MYAGIYGSANIFAFIVCSRKKQLSHEFDTKWMSDTNEFYLTDYSWKFIAALHNPPKTWSLSIFRWNSRKVSQIRLVNRIIVQRSFNLHLTNHKKKFHSHTAATCRLDHAARICVYLSRMTALSLSFFHITLANALSFACFVILLHMRHATCKPVAPLYADQSKAAAKGEKSTTCLHVNFVVVVEKINANLCFFFKKKADQHVKINICWHDPSQHHFITHIEVRMWFDQRLKSCRKWKKPFVFGCINIYLVPVLHN